MGDASIQICLTAKAGVRDLIHCHTPSPSWYHLKENLRQSRMTASPLFELEAGITPYFSMRVACPDREPLICIPSTRYGRIARADPGHHCREVSSTWNIVHRLCLLPLLLLLTASTLALQDRLSVLVGLKLSDDDLGRGEGDGDGLAIGLLADDCVLCKYHVLDN